MGRSLRSQLRGISTCYIPSTKLVGAAERNHSWIKLPRTAKASMVRQPAAAITSTAAEQVAEQYSSSLRNFDIQAGVACVKPRFDWIQSHLCTRPRKLSK